MNNAEDERINGKKVILIDHKGEVKASRSKFEN